MGIGGRMTKFRIDELSGVDRPAQKGARKTIMKRDFTAEERQAMADKGHAMADGSFPIPDQASLKDAIRAIGRASDPSAAKAHIIRRAKALGSTDILPEGWVKKDSEGDPMSPTIKKALGLADTATDEEVTAAITKRDEDLKKATDELALAKAAADLTDGEKAHCAKMSEGDKSAFAAMDKPARAAAMAKAASEDEVAEIEGQTIRKSEVGAAVFALMQTLATKIAKGAEDFAKAQEATETANFTKAATVEYPHVAGTVDERVAMLKHISKADEATRKAFDAVLTANERLAKSAFSKAGTLGGEMNPEDPTAKLEKMAKDRADASGGKTTFAKAYADVCAENPALYEAATQPAAQ